VGDKKYKQEGGLGKSKPLELKRKRVSFRNTPPGKKGCRLNGPAWLEKKEEGSSPRKKNGIGVEKRQPPTRRGKLVGGGQGGGGTTWESRKRTLGGRLNERVEGTAPLCSC